jgi:N-acetylmuramoyl-L-alanine amidase
MATFVISSGHGKYVPGAIGIISEVENARLVTEEVARMLRNLDNTVYTFHDNTSDDQSENLAAITAYHDSQERDYDVSVHFNSYDDPDAHGTEVLYLTQEDLAGDISAAIAAASGLYDRGAKFRDNLAFLNNTNEPAVLLEICFVTNQNDVDLYQSKFDDICFAIAEVLDEYGEDKEMA